MSSEITLDYSHHSGNTPAVHHADPHPYSPIQPRVTGDASADALHAEVRRADDAWRRARAERSPADVVRRLAADYIKASEGYQRARFGSVRQRISLSALLR